MALGAIVDADYTSVINTVRNSLAHGGTLSDRDLRLILQVVKDSITRLGLARTEVAALRVTWDAQIAILQAMGTNDASAEIDAADTAIEADVAAAETATPAAPTYVANSVLDGG